MIYREYGSTGIEVSAIGMGGMRFADQEDVDGCASLMKAAYDAGINYFDTAPGYGKSESLYGVALKEMLKTREEKPFYVSTKTFGLDADAVRKDLENSLERMGLDYIDFHHVWCILTPDKWRERKPVLKEFEKLKEEGLIKHICVSSHMTGTDISEMLEDYPFEGVLLGYSAMNFAYREAALDCCARDKRGVVVMNPLGGGVIPENPDRFGFVKTRADETVVEGALRFLINDPRITVSLVGLSSEEQLREAVSAADGFTPISDGEILKIRAGVKEAFNELCTGCGYCDDCPQGIPVPKLMDGYNQYKLSGDANSMVNRFRWHWGIGLDSDVFEKCTECGACEAACTQKLPIVERIAEAKAIVEKKRAEEAAKARE